MDLLDSNSDNYVHLREDLIYASTSVPGPGVNLPEMDSQLAGCCCSACDDCLKSLLCQSIHVCSPNYSCNKLLVENKWDCSGIVECNSLCNCPQSCENRVVQFGPRGNLEVFHINDSKGYGLRTHQFIPKGAFICEYAGEVIGMSEAKRRFREILTSNGMNYIFVLREFVKSTNTVIETVVDPSFIGNIGRYINHSCVPNSGVLPVRIDSSVPRLGIFAKTNIMSGEEITYDYSGGEAAAPHGELDNSFRKICLCMAETCKGFLPYDMSLL